MHGETQANRLAELMKQRGNLPSYELALHLVAVRSSSLKKLDINDILLLGLNHLECILIDDGTICAKTVLIKQNNRHVMKVVESVKEPIKHYDGKKYEMLKLSFGEIQSRTLDVGHTIDMSQVNLEKVSLVRNVKKIATASLINVDGQIALQIDKVERDG